MHNLVAIGLNHTTPYELLFLPLNYEYDGSGQETNSYLPRRRGLPHSLSLSPGWGENPVVSIPLLTLPHFQSFDHPLATPAAHGRLPAATGHRGAPGRRSEEFPCRFHRCLPRPLRFRELHSLSLLYSHSYHVLPCRRHRSSLSVGIFMARRPVFCSDMQSDFTVNALSIVSCRY